MPTNPFKILKQYGENQDTWARATGKEPYHIGPVESMKPRTDG